MNENLSILKPFWNHLIKSTWIFGLALIFVVGIPRFLMVLSANVSGHYHLLSLIFIFMWLTPWIFLSRFGRSKIGLKKPGHAEWLLYGFIIGILLSAIMFLIATFLYQDSISNWLVYISKSYTNLPENLNAPDRFNILRYLRRYQYDLQPNRRRNILSGDNP